MVSQRYRLILIVVAFFLAGIYFFIFSNSGLLERIRLEKGKENLQKKIESLRTENGRLQKSLQSYKKGEYPVDDILNSGFREPGGKFYFLRGMDKKTSAPPPGEILTPGSSPLLSYLQAGWLFISFSILAVIYLYARKRNEVDAID